MDIDRRVVLSKESGRAITARRAGDVGLWLKPELDDDGEYAITFEELVAVLDELGVNRADLMVGRWAVA